MNISIKIILVNLFITICIFVQGQTDIADIKSQILLGDFHLAESKIDEMLNYNSSLVEKIELHKLKGDIFLIEGNIENAYSQWKLSNEYRSSHYTQGDYHLAWNYALISNYYYEKIYTDLAITYADSCATLIKNLNPAQQKEIEIYKIWNILAQSYKQEKKGFSHQEIRSNYIIARSYYSKSIAFINKNKINQHHLAIANRLLGNSYLDLIFHSETDYILNYKKATEYYTKSYAIWNEKYESRHFEKARTLFVQGLLNYYAKDSFVFESNKIAINSFEQSLIAYGLNDNEPFDISSISNKEDFLMTCSYLTKSYFREFKKHKEIDWLNRAKEINVLAVNAWNEIHSSFDSRNTNQNLAIYGVIPFEQTIAIEVLKKEFSLECSLNTIFKANQKLKYFDLLNASSLNKNMIASISIEELQKRLNPHEIFLDFHISIATNQLIILKVSQQKSELILTSSPSISAIENLNKAINNFEFELFSESAQILYSEIIEPCAIMNQDIIICLDGILHNVPFEALLTSERNIDKKDYRILDYLLLKNKIHYVLNPQMFRSSQIASISFSIAAFAPINPNYSELPYSKVLLEHLNGEYKADIYIGKDATKATFLNSTNSILHLSGHGSVDSKKSWNSGLVFSDSLLLLSDINNLKHSPQLVVLNTCNSSLGKVYRGDGVNGFVRAFHANGVNTTLSNIWEVDDKVSNELLADFYSHLSEGNSTVDALILSKKEQIHNVPNSKMAAPYYWAGHRLVGEEVEYKKNKEDSYFEIFFVLGIILLLFFLILFIKRKKVSFT